MKTWRCLAVMAVIGLLGLSGCASSPPSTFYALMPIPEANARAATVGAEGPKVGLGPVTLPDFLDRPQIVVRDGVQLQFDEFHRWGGPLEDDFVRVWGENLAYLLDTGHVFVYPTEVEIQLDFRVVAEVLRFQGNTDGNVELKVRWVVLDPYRDESLLVREGSYRRAIPVTPEGTIDDTVLVAGLSTVLGDFSRDVADALQQMPRPQPPPDDPLLFD